MVSILAFQLKSWKYTRPTYIVEIYATHLVVRSLISVLQRPVGINANFCLILEETHFMPAAADWLIGIQTPA